LLSLRPPSLCSLCSFGQILLFSAVIAPRRLISPHLRSPTPNTTLVVFHWCQIRHRVSGPSLNESTAFAPRSSQSRFACIRLGSNRLRCHSTSARHRRRQPDSIQ